MRVERGCRTALPACASARVPCPGNELIIFDEGQHCGEVTISVFGVRREKAALSQWVQSPPGKMLQPEAIGATMEVTK